MDAGELKAVVKAFYEWQGQSVDDAKIDADVAVRPRTHALTYLLTYLPSGLVAWHSGRTSVSDWRTFPVLRSTCS